MNYHSSSSNTAFIILFFEGFFKICQRLDQYFHFFVVRKTF